jgi:hypothetical protein
MTHNPKREYSVTQYVASSRLFKLSTGLGWALARWLGKAYRQWQHHLQYEIGVPLPVAHCALWGRDVHVKVQDSGVRQELSEGLCTSFKQKRLKSRSELEIEHQFAVFVA